MLAIGSLVTVTVRDPSMGLWVRTGRVVRIRPQYNEVLVLFSDNELCYAKISTEG